MNIEKINMVKEELEDELKTTERRIFSKEYNKCDEWDKGYLNGREIGLRIALQTIRKYLGN